MTAVKARGASEFVDSAGVVIHIDNNLSGSTLLGMMNKLGFHHIRTGTPSQSILNSYTTLGHGGCKFVLFECNVYMGKNEVNASNDVHLADPLEQQCPGCVLAMEGTNEYDFWHYKLNGQDSYQNYGNWGPDDAKQLDNAVKASSHIRDVGRVSPSVQQIAKMPRTYGDTITASNSHAYSPDPGSNVQHHIKAGIDYAKTYASGKPVYITETGMTSCGYVNGGYSNGTEQTQMIVTMNCILEGFYNGAAKTYIYELMDWTAASGDVERNFGLHYSNGSPKPAANAIGNLMKIVSSSQVDELRELDFGISGLPSTASYTLLQKADGAFLIVMWNGGAKISDGHQDIEVKPVNVTITFATPASVVQVYDPVVGTTPRSTANNVQSMDVSLAATPVIVEVPTKTTIVSTGATDTFNYI